MIIHSIRLRNIKSYGEGEGGKGVTIAFEPGVNRIAGRNGHGKSTLIEALGYALFLCEPQFEENFKIERYFLSHGSKEGEIDVTFSIGGESYRVERGIGAQSKRASKVVQLSDGSICAERDEQVSRFLCELLNFPEPKRLQELFLKLVGIKQGRLTWPFDSTPGEAKKFFEPLLDVAVFRECFDKLKPAVEIFAGQASELENRDAHLQGQIAGVADCEENLKKCRQDLGETESKFQELKGALEGALKARNEQEQLRKANDAAKVKVASCEQTLAHAERFRIAAQQGVSEAEQALEITKQNQAAYNAYLEAGAALEKLEARRVQRDEIGRKRSENENARVRSEAEKLKARDKAATFAGQRTEKETERTATQAHLDQIRGIVESTRSAFEQESNAIAKAKLEIAAVNALVTRLEALETEQDRRTARIKALNAEVSSWDQARLKEAEHAEAETTQAYESTKEQLARARERVKALREQLKEIAGGICPFLKKQCPTFDPDQVSTDLEASELEIRTLQDKEAAAAKSHIQLKDLADRLRGSARITEAKRNDLQILISDYSGVMSGLVPEKTLAGVRWLRAWAGHIPASPEQPVCSPPAGLSEPEVVFTAQAGFARWVADMKDWWSDAESRCQEKLEQFAATAVARAKQDRDISNLGSKISALDREIAQFNSRIIEAHSEEKAHGIALAKCAREVAACDEQLKAFTALDGDIKLERDKKASNEPGFTACMRAKGLAEEIGKRRSILETRKQEESSAATALAQAKAEAEKAAAAFDEKKVESANEAYEVKRRALDESAFILKQLRSKSVEEERRFCQWQSYCNQREQLQLEIGRLRAAIDLTQAARETLKKAAPEVARHICRRIAQRAQRMFNQISPEPIGLEWDSDHYSLRVDPGDRRFSMLSGGEQTKLALAMTLAMIEEFSGLRFCIFDEPTYGVDADSRKKLADAILEAQQAAGLEQLLLVSHDDAFEGKIEHSIVLSKVAGRGTAALEF